MLRSLPPLQSNSRRKRLFQLALLIFLVVALFFGGSIILSVASSFANYLFVPVLKAESAFSRSANVWFFSIFASKSSLLEENESLRHALEEANARMLDRDALLQENNALKEAWGRHDEENSVLAAVVSSPNRSPYDTLLVDVGSKHNVQSGDFVSAYGSVIIGRVGAVYEKSSLVKLFSSPGEEQQVVIGTSTPGKAIGVGGGNFRIILPKGVDVRLGDPVVLSAISSKIYGKVEEIESGSSEAFQKIFFQSPINLSELRWVEIIMR